MAVTIEVVRAFTNALVSEMIAHVRKEYKHTRFDVDVRCDAGLRRTTSWGGMKDGNGFISLCVKKYLHNSGDFTFKEYAHVASDPVIGSIKGEWKATLSALIAHEVAHAVVHVVFPYRIYSTAVLRKEPLPNWPSHDFTSHGKLWQHIYRDLRVKFVNNQAYRSLSYTVAAPAPVTMTVAKKQNRPYYTKEVNKNGGRHALYYRTSDNTLIGKLFKRENQYVQFAAGDDKYKWTNFFGVTEARKALIEPLI